MGVVLENTEHSSQTENIIDLRWREEKIILMSACS